MLEHALRKFSRITSGGRIIPEVEGLRFIAITTVFLFHLSGHLMKRELPRFDHGPFEHGLIAVLVRLGIAVPLFFTISAFILGLRFARQHILDGPPVSLSAYYLRRLTRLEPTYLISLVLVLPFSIVLVGGLHHIGLLLPHLLASATYTHGAVFGTRSIINGVTWSLEVEIQFYILAPLLALLYKLRGAALRYVVYIGMVAVALCWQHFHAADVYLLFLPSYLQFFIAGFFLADLYVTRWKGAPQLSAMGDLYSLAGWSALAFCLMVGGVATWFECGAIALAYAGAFRGKLTRRALSNEWITTIGGMCYTPYTAIRSSGISCCNLFFSAPLSWSRASSSFVYSKDRSWTRSGRARR
jgi:peptidoglycan/LPS O-acetylase OafA/YrhL